MAGKYQRYAEYKDSGVEWLGKIPSHWNAKRLGQFFEERREKVNDKEFMPLSVTMNGIVPQLDNAAKTDAGDNRKLVKKGDFVINSRSDRKGSSGVSGLTGSVSLISIVMEPKRYSASYAHHLLRSQPFQEEFYRFGKGIVADLWSTNSSELKNIIIPDLPDSEATTIANFLDHETDKIDALITKQEKLIELLDEKFQAAVATKILGGIDANVKTRSAELDWCGSVPKHWKTLELKFCAKDGYKSFTDGDWIESPFITKSGVRLLQTGNVGIGEFKEKGFRYISEDSFKQLRCTEVNPNDVLICRLDGPVGRSCLAPNLGVKTITSVDNAILKVNSDFDARYIVYLTNCTPWLQWIADLCRVGGGFRLRISRTMLGNQKIPAPPKNEQILIADELDALKQQTQKCKEQCSKSIELLKERKVALISESVTGKIDVRRWQPNKKDEAYA